MHGYNHEDQMYQSFDSFSTRRSQVTRLTAHT